jgi:predicted NAD-dependent protein-ADP-ribosyltransferase YbiA (DUF1768 family)
MDHINIFSKSESMLGRLLSNFAHTPFTSRDGRFESVEGYWFWLLTPHAKDRETLRSLYGFKAKQLGQSLSPNRALMNLSFNHSICWALKAKCEQTPELRNLLIQSSLPFTHYYQYGDKKIPAGYEWLCRAWERIRQIEKEKS